MPTALSLIKYMFLLLQSFIHVSLVSRDHLNKSNRFARLTGYTSVQDQQMKTMTTLYVSHVMEKVLKTQTLSRILQCPRLPFDPLEWPESNFSSQYNPWIKHTSHKNKGNDFQQRKLLIVRRILLVSTVGNVWRTVWRICTLMVGCKG